MTVSSTVTSCYCGRKVYWHLSSLPDVLAVTDSFPADEPDNSSVPSILVRNVYTRMEDVSIVKGSQAVALVCRYLGQGGWPLETSTVRFQRLEIDIEPVWYPVPDGDGLIRGGCFYGGGTFGDYGPVIQVGSAESGSGGDAGG